MKYESVDDLLDAYERGERPALVFSKHALLRGVEMSAQLGLTPEEIRLTVVDPWTFALSRKHAGAMNLARGRVCLGVTLAEDGSPLVTTIVWRRQGDWVQSHNAMPVPGRAPREKGLRP